MEHYQGPNLVGASIEATREALEAKLSLISTQTVAPGALEENFMRQFLGYQSMKLCHPQIEAYQKCEATARTETKCMQAKNTMMFCRMKTLNKSQKKCAKHMMRLQRSLYEQDNKQAFYAKRYEFCMQSNDRYRATTDFETNLDDRQVLE